METNPTINLPESVYPHLADAQLVALVRLGMIPAYDCLVRRYRAAVCMTAARFVGQEAAQDIAQEVFLVAFHALHQLEDPACFGGWLRSIARHRAERWAKREGRLQPMDLPLLEWQVNHAGQSESGLTPEETHLAEERRGELRRAVAGLSETHREVIMLHYFEDWPLARIAVFLSVSEDVVRGRLYRARMALRRLLADLAERK